MKKYQSLLGLCLLPIVALSGCGYHLGGLRADVLKDKETFCINMFSNHSTQPMAAMLMTNALADALQRDGSFRMAAPANCDFRIDGAVTSIGQRSYSTSPNDSYVSSELGLTINVVYRVVDAATGKELMTGSTQASGSYFNTVGNVQSGRDAALSYAARQAADNIVDKLTIP